MPRNSNENAERGAMEIDNAREASGNTFRAAVLTQLGQPLELVDLHFPEELLPGQVLVQITFSGACASQVHEIDGRKGPDRYLPHLLGHEAVGRVTQCGPGVKTVGEGQIVVAHWRKGDGIDAEPAIYDSSFGKINAGQITTFSEYSVIAENRLTPLPEGIALEDAPLLGCAFATGFGAVTREAIVQPGESAVIIGFGGVGISILKSLKLVSAKPIVVVDIVESKLNFAQQNGADFVVQADSVGTDIVHEVKKFIPGGPDVVFEVTGHQRPIEDSYAMTHHSGRTILVGVPNKANPASFQTLPLHLGQRLIGSHGGSAQPAVDIPRIAGLVKGGLLKLDDFPKAFFNLENINKALDSLRGGTLGRILVRM